MGLRCIPLAIPSPLTIEQAGTRHRYRGLIEMRKKPVRVLIVDQGQERFILRTFSDGTKEREPIVKLPRKKRYPPRPYWDWKFSKGRKKGL